MHAIELYLVALAGTLPLELFVSLGSFAEEVIAPIPSPSIMVIAGSFGAIQGYSYHALALLVLLASIGKTLGGLTMYAIACYARGPAFRLFGRFIDLTESDIDAFGKRFTGSLHDYVLYIFFRSVPIIPSILLSFGSGAIRLPLKLFIIGTFVGTVFRDTFYLIVGYSGTGLLREILTHTTVIEDYGQYVFFGILGATLIYFVYRRHKRASGQSR
jgi:membrane protein DedA with SNARE-associated domain